MRTAAFCPWQSGRQVLHCTGPITWLSAGVLTRYKENLGSIAGWKGTAEVRKPGTKRFCVSKQANSQQGDCRPPRVERGHEEQ